MKEIKFLFISSLLLIFVCACHSTKKRKPHPAFDEEPVVISNDSLEYEIIIFEQGFVFFLQSTAKPKWYYTEDFYEIKNKFYVQEWNARARAPQQFPSSIYEQEINYNPFVKYGLDVNYKLYNYFKFIENKYKINF